MTTNMVIGKKYEAKYWNGMILRFTYLGDNKSYVPTAYCGNTKRWNGHDWQEAGYNGFCSEYISNWKDVIEL